MKVILKQDVANIGDQNEVCDVAPGYARNYLFPRGMAVPATKGAIKKAEHLREQQKISRAKAHEKSELIAEKIQEESLTFRVKAGETGQLYGSITSQDIADEIEKVIADTFDKRQIVLEQPLRELGEHKIELKLDAGVSSEVQVLIEAEE